MKTEKTWSWKRTGRHINVLETFSAVGCLELAGVSSPDSRCITAVDSNVARGALSKGRSSAYSLQPSLKRSCALQLAFGLYPSWIFSPTRLNTADDGSRGKETRTGSSGSILAFLNAHEIKALHQIGLRRAFANWFRLILLLILCSPVDCAPNCARECHAACGVPDALSKSSCFGSSECAHFPDFSAVLDCQWTLLRSVSTFGLSLLDFVSWPRLWSFGLIVVSASFWIFASLSFLGSLGRRPPLNKAMVVVGIFVSQASLPHGVILPQNDAERGRAAATSVVDLPADRVLRKETRSRRHLLLGRFRTWLWADHEISLRGLLDQKPPDAEKINYWLSRFGREMFSAGKSYNQYAETINAVTMLKPLLKKQMTPSWDIAYAWLADEPHQRHPALPVSTLLAMMALCLYWGWIHEACVLGLTWSGILRIGEVLQAVRLDLVLPQDQAPGSQFILLKIRDPKTRGRAARHQAARVDQQDLVRLLVATYGRFDNDQKLWPFSAATLRSRFSHLLRTLGLPTKQEGNVRPFDLGSLRPGGATWLLNFTENSELVRRRGRWLSNRVMEVYLQEILVATHLQRLTEAQRDRILQYALCFEPLLDLAISYLDLAIPTTTWYHLLRPQRVVEAMGEGAAEKVSYPCASSDAMPV